MAEQQPMTEAAYYILLSLLHPGHGYGMMQRIRELSGGRLVMGPGTLYGVLSRMSREGLIVLTGEADRRKTYAITDQGPGVVSGEARSLSQPLPPGRAGGYALPYRGICPWISGGDGPSRGTGGSV